MIVMCSSTKDNLTLVQAYEEMAKVRGNSVKTFNCEGRYANCPPSDQYQ